MDNRQMPPTALKHQPVITLPNLTTLLMPAARTLSGRPAVSMAAIKTLPSHLLTAICVIGFVCWGLYFVACDLGLFG
jgi:hypothetical protein